MRARTKAPAWQMTTGRMTPEVSPMLPQSPTFGDPRLPLRFWAKVRILDNGCWEWMAYRNAEGYGMFGIGSRVDGVALAHRFAYMKLIGPIQQGLQSDHLCHTISDCLGGRNCPHRRCVYPLHIEPVSSRENNLRGNGFSAREARQTHCLRGHPFDLLNTYVAPNSGRRRCRICRSQEPCRTIQTEIGEAWSQAPR